MTYQDAVRSIIANPTTVDDHSADSDVPAGYARCCGSVKMIDIPLQGQVDGHPFIVLMDHERDISYIEVIVPQALS